MRPRATCAIPVASSRLQQQQQAEGGGEAYRVGGIIWLDSLALEKEAHRGDVLALALAEGAHELLQLGRLLYLEEDLVVVVSDLDVQVLRLGGGLLALRPGGAVLVVFGRHSRQSSRRDRPRCGRGCRCR